MRKFNASKLKKRVLSAALAVGMVATLLSTADWSSVVNAADAREEVITYTSGANIQRVRGVLNSDLPLAMPNEVRSQGTVSRTAAYMTFMENNWYNKEKGTVDRPFVVLDIVPYYEQASFGYLIEGCEPFAFERMSGDLYLMGKAASLASKGFMDIKKINDKTKFFLDEDQAKREYYRAEGIVDYRVATDAEWESTYVKTDEQVLDGYYETVNRGEGDFRIAEDVDGKKHIVVANNAVESEKGTLKWHTLNQYVLDDWAERGYSLPQYMTFEEVQARDDLDINDFIDRELKLSEIGARYRTKRVSGTADPYVEIPSGWIWIYQSTDLFARDTLGLTKQQAQSYSILFKAITPVELNANPIWADVADLVYVERENKCGDLVKTFYEAGANQYRRANLLTTPNALDPNKCKYVGKYDAGDYTGWTGLSFSQKDKDINGEVAMRLFDRVGWQKNYVGIVWDQTWADGITRTSVDHYVYNLANQRIKDDTNRDIKYASQASHSMNLGKLYVMCTTLRANLIKRFFLDSGKVVIDSNGNLALADNINRTADEQKYWNGMTFYIGADMYGNVAPGSVDTLGADGSTVTYGKSRYWKDYGGYIDFLLDPVYVQGHCYTYNGNQAIFMGFEESGTSGVGANPDRYVDFDEYARTNGKTQEIWKSLHGGSAFTGNSNTTSPWVALRYILDIDKDSDVLIGELVALDVEPSVGLNSASEPVWQLTEDMVALMVPSLAAEAVIHIDHYIMGAFVGTFADLNTTYDLIYLGDDAGGLWTGRETELYKNNNNKWGNDSATAGLDRTNFVDNTMDGLVYFHIGDRFKLGYYAGQDRSCYFLYDFSRVAAKNYVYESWNKHIVNTDDYTRQPGNDLTNVKKKSLVEYVTAGYPIIAAENLYDESTHPYVDKSAECVLWQFLDGNRAVEQTDGSYSNGILKHTQVSEIDKRVLFRRNLKMEITRTPVEYDFNNTDLSTRKYVPKEGSFGRLDFSFKVPAASGYSYKVYLDQDRNSKFTSGEVAQGGTISGLTKDATVYVTDGWVGFIQWRVEVFKTDNPNARVAKEGCSAIQALATNKNKIIALQIAPDGTTLSADLSNYSGTRDPATNGETDENKIHGVKKGANAWSNLYDKVTDFDIEVYTITYTQFEKLFRRGVNGDGESYGFSYDMSKPIDIAETTLNTNPNREILKHVEDQDEHENLKNTLLGGHKLSAFNMIILGFADSYGSKDISNKYGCAEYLFYFADKGKSILFTHDLTSWRNGFEYITGFTATTMLRDIMGMNKYGVVSSYLVNDTSADHNFNVDTTSRLAKSIAEYNEKKMIPYETTTKNERHAYTYLDLAIRVGNNDSNNNRGLQYPGDRRLQFKFSVLNPATYNSSTKKYSEVRSGYLNNGGTNSGSSGNVGDTDVAQMLNKGQITEYPFQIPDTLKIANTHAQWFQLNMEDPELTVWYTLADAETARNAAGNRVGTTTGRSDHMNLLYGCIPQDASNNYYIYSKGNIFYSGVGHSTVNGDDERRLFVNTLIAAYRPTAQAPEVIIMNPEAVKSGNQYTIRVDQEFDYDEATGNVIVTSFTSGGGDIPVYFRPIDYSLSPTVKVRIYYEGGTRFFGSGAYAIYEANSDGSRGAQVTSVVPGQPNWYILESQHDYMIYHQKSNLSNGDAWNHILFDAKNDRTDDSSTTELFFKPRPLFTLD